jgi:formylglycine-generating enzyme required for sulfatase activity
VREPFYLGTCEVTVEQFRRFVEAKNFRTTAERNGKGGEVFDHDEKKYFNKPEYIWSYKRPWSTDKSPVVFVAAEDAEAFCAWLSDVEGRRYALPSSEQWEYAGRAGTTTLWWTGDDQEELLRREVLEGRSSLKVGSRSPNPFGFYDMLGNVSEWCRDSTNYSRRGGHAGAPVRSSHSAFRWNAREPQAHGGTGFRVAVVGDLRQSTPPRELGPAPRVATDPPGKK